MIPAIHNFEGHQASLGVSCHIGVDVEALPTEPGESDFRHCVGVSIANLLRRSSFHKPADSTGSETIADCWGLAHRHPLLAVTFAVFLFSLTGLPPHAGLTGKWYLFVAVLSPYAEEGGAWYVTLAVVAALNTAISLYYYVRIIRAMFIEAPASDVLVRSCP